MQFSCETAKTPWTCQRLSRRVMPQLRNVLERLETGTPC
ncbi:hypothetical protein X971_2310 [Agrobacterium tumefaciens LBA4213 (Ach5)]|nr:hypothetical protein X971_2310 [Agrobacterium tumefaciens LBA4213 (Ach5)]